MSNKTTLLEKSWLLLCVLNVLCCASSQPLCRCPAPTSLSWAVSYCYYTEGEQLSSSGASICTTWCLWPCSTHPPMASWQPFRVPPLQEIVSFPHTLWLFVDYLSWDVDFPLLRIISWFVLWDGCLPKRSVRHVFWNFKAHQECTRLNNLKQSFVLWKQCVSVLNKATHTYASMAHVPYQSSNSYI